MPDRKTLPAAVVPDEAHQLLTDYAFDNRITVSEAVRRLLQSSPDLIAYATKKGVKLDFGVGTWRGQQGDGD